MKENKKIRVGVLYGGRSGEHEVSLRSAASVIKNLDREKFIAVPIAITKEGKWLLQDLEYIIKGGDSLLIDQKAPQVLLSTNPKDSSERTLISVEKGEKECQQLDVFFPVIHGPLCEDGTIQGLMELAEVAYVGCGVLASSVGMDKEVAKRLARDVGLPIVPFVLVRRGEWKRNSSLYSGRIATELSYPVFVKPVNMGSSVGVHKVKDKEFLKAAMDDAFKYDTKVLVEQAIDAREIEVAVLENQEEDGEPLTTIPGEITPNHEFYSYEAKYLDDKGAGLYIPAKLDVQQAKEVQRIAKEAFTVLQGEGMARADFFLDRQSGKFYFNEVNTIPGFTSISMYPKLWEASGLSYKALLTRLIELATSRQNRKKALAREFVR